MTIPTHISKLLDDYLDGNLSPADHDLVAQWAQESDEHRDALADWFLCEAEIRRDTKIASLCDTLRGQGLFESATLVAADTLTPREAQLKRSLNSARLNTLAVVTLSSAALLLIGYFSWRSPDPAKNPVAATKADPDRNPTRPADARVATLGRLSGCEWAEGSPQLEIGGGVAVGETLQLTKGLASFVFESGAEIIVEGPAKLRADGPQLCALMFGSIAANVPPEATGFTVRGPASEVIDLGTQFGFSVSRDGSSEVHVFKGRVVTQSLDVNGKGTGDRLVLEQNEAVLFPHTVEEARRLAADEAKFVRTVPTDWSPDDIELINVEPTPNLWLRAGHGVETDSSGGVIAWHDLSIDDETAATDAFQSKIDSRPRLTPTAINGRPAVRFDGVDDYLTTTPMGTSNDQTIVVAFQNVDQPQKEPGQIINYNGPPSRVPDLAAAGVLQLGENVRVVPLPATSVSAKAYAGRTDDGRELDSGFTTSEPLGYLSPCVAVYVYDYTNRVAKLYVNGVVVSQSEAWAPVAVASRKVLGKHGIFDIRYYSGDVAEVMLFNAALDDTAAKQVTQQLMTHYGVSKPDSKQY